MTIDDLSRQMSFSILDNNDDRLVANLDPMTLTNHSPPEIHAMSYFSLLGCKN